MKTRKLAVSVAVSLMACNLNAPAQTSPAAPNGVYSLDQFGPVSTGAEAEQTFQKASKEIMNSGGGVLMIPSKIDPSFVPKNTSQETWRTPPPPAPARRWGVTNGVTVVDTRGKNVKIMPPQASGIELNRTLDINNGPSLPFWGLYPVLDIKNTILYGSCSYRDFLVETVEPGKNRKFYVNTIRGIFPGMFMSGSYGAVERLFVQSIGYDKEKKLWYFVADCEGEQGKGSVLGNKNHVNALKMETWSHNENQTFDVMMWRHNYSQGDNYLMDARFKYMSDVHSTAGDENGVIYGAFVEAETGIFRGKVEKYTVENNEIVFSGDQGKTLGSGRPIINMNPAKWVTNGTVVIVQPGSWTETKGYWDDPVYLGKTYPTTLGADKAGIPGICMGGLIRFSADATITDDVVGRYFSVDEVSECVDRTTPPVHRWYLIDSVTKNADGTKDIKIIRHWWGAKPMCSPRLYKRENTTYDGHVRPLKYIIAPGANAYDVSEGVNNPKAIIRVVPNPVTGTPLDYKPGDLIEQAIGPDPFKPIAFRSWIWDAVPGAFPAPLIDINNNGVMRDIAFQVRGVTSGSYEKDLANRFDQNPPWDRFLSFDTTCNTGIKFGGEVGNAAILFTQPNNRPQPLKWHYNVTSNAAPKVATLTVSPTTGDLNFEGGTFRVNGVAVAAGGGGALRGFNVPVKAGQLSVQVSFNSNASEADANYGVFIEQNWIGNRAIVKKETGGFIVQFEKPAPENAKLDWMVMR